MQGHKPVYSFTKVTHGKPVDVFPCACGVVGYRPGGTEEAPVRDPARFKGEQFATCEGKLKADKRKKHFYSSE